MKRRSFLAMLFSGFGLSACAADRIDNGPRKATGEPIDNGPVAAIKPQTIPKAKLGIPYDADHREIVPTEQTKPEADSARFQYTLPGTSSGCVNGQCPTSSVRRFRR